MDGELLQREVQEVAGSAGGAIMAFVATIWSDLQADPWRALPAVIGISLIIMAWRGTFPRIGGGGR